LRLAAKCPNVHVTVVRLVSLHTFHEWSNNQPERATSAALLSGRGGSRGSAAEPPCNRWSVVCRFAGSVGHRRPEGACQQQRSAGEQEGRRSRVKRGRDGSKAEGGDAWQSGGESENHGGAGAAAELREDEALTMPARGGGARRVNQGKME
jgi:hypothetical protein